MIHYANVAKVIIIEEDPAVRDLLAIVVRRLGHDPAPLLSATEPRMPADAALIEPADPRALSLTQQLRREQPGLEIVFVSTLPPAAETQELRPSTHLIKPFALGELSAAIERSVGGARPEARRAVPAGSERPAL